MHAIAGPKEHLRSNGCSLTKSTRQLRSQLHLVHCQRVFKCLSICVYSPKFHSLHLAKVYRNTASNAFYFHNLLKPDLQPASNHSVDGVASSSTYPDDLDLSVTSCTDNMHLRSRQCATSKVAYQKALTNWTKSIVARVRQGHRDATSACLLPRQKRLRKFGALTNAAFDGNRY